jgi:serine/threonine protein kinase
MNDPDAPFREPGSVVLKDSRTTKVAEVVLPVGGVPTKVIYKRFNRKKWLDPLLALFRPTRGWRAWQSGQHLNSRGLPTPRNLAFIQKQAIRRGWAPTWLLPLDTYILTIRAEPSMTVADYVSRCISALSEPRRRQARHDLAKALARLVRSMHERSLSHRDLKAANILVEGDPLAEILKLTLIDLVGVDLSHPLSQSRRVKDLARLHVSMSRLDGWSRTMALRFLRDYLPWASTRRDDWKALWRAVERRALKKERRNKRNGRILS